MKKSGYVALALLLMAQTGFACTVTINPGSNVISSAVSAAATGATICLNNGTYTQTISIPMKQGQTLKGVGTNRTDAVISSSASEIITSAPGTTFFNFHIVGNSSPPPTVGIALNSDPNTTVWGLRIEHVVSALSIFWSDDSNVWDLQSENNGNSADTIPDTDIYIQDSSGVEILYGFLVGQNDGPYGDGGSIVCFRSSDLLIDGTAFAYSGNSSVYFVDCDDSTVQNATIYASNEWGLDIVSGPYAGHGGPPHYMDGTSGFTAIGNTISNSYFGGSVFDKAGNGQGTYTNNTFINNNQSGTPGFCNGINVTGPNTSVAGSGNTVNTGLLICPH